MKFVLLIFLAVTVVSTQAQAQNCNRENIVSTTPSAQFTLNADGTVVDTRTKLMWKRCLEGKSGNKCEAGTATAYNWLEALQAADAASFAGYSDWRVPNIKELASLIEEQCRDPAINLRIFPGLVNPTLWSSSPMLDNDLTYGILDFKEGKVTELYRNPSAEPSGRGSSRQLLLVRNYVS